MKALLLLVFIIGIAVLPYVLRRLLNKGIDKAADAIRNKRIDNERLEGKPNKTENLADRYNNNND